VQIKTKAPKDAAQSLIKLCGEIRTQGALCHSIIVRHGLIPCILKALKSGSFHERLSSSEALFSLTLNEEAVSSHLMEIFAILISAQCIAIRAANGFAKIADRIAEGPRGGSVTTNCIAALANVCYFKQHAEAMRFLNVFT
jgi:hypothetical protein